MLRFGFNVNPFLYLNKFMPFKSYSIHHLISLAEIENVDSFSVYYDEKYALLSQREVMLMNALSHKFINIHTPVEKEEYRQLLEAKPNMITFTNGLNTSTFDTEPTNIQQKFEFLKSAIENIKKSNIMCSIKLKVDINEVKLAAKLPFDYIEFDISPLNSCESLTQEMELIEELKMACLVADKFDLGVMTSGLVTTENLEHLKKIPQIEEFYTSKHFFERCMVHGLPSSVKEYRTIVQIQ